MLILGTNSLRFFACILTMRMLYYVHVYTSRKEIGIFEGGRDMNNIHTTILTHTL
jgi:hypothetical protein